MVAKKRKRIALIGFPIAPLRVIPIYSAIAQHHSRNKVDWEVVASVEGNVESMEFLKFIKCDGAFVRLLNDEMASVARTIDFPVVNISSWLADPGVHTVIFDEARRGQLAAEHFLDKGFERFVCINSPGGHFIKRREQGYVERVLQEGRQCWSFALSSFRPAVGELRRLACDLRKLSPPFAIFCTNDPAAPVIFEACQSAEIVIPQDAAVIGAIDRKDICFGCKPSLSSVYPDENAICKTAVELLDKLMDGPAVPPQMVLRKPEGVIERESSDTFATNDSELAQAIEFIRRNVQHGIDVSDVVKQANVSRITLERRFRKHLAASPKEFITRLRVKRTKDLLKANREMSLQEVAERCGFSDRNRMRITFEREVGMTAQEYRRRRAKSSKVSIVVSE